MLIAWWSECTSLSALSMCIFCKCHPDWWKQPWRWASCLSSPNQRIKTKYPIKQHRQMSAWPWGSENLENFQSRRFLCLQILLSLFTWSAGYDISLALTFNPHLLPWNLQSLLLVLTLERSPVKDVICTIRCGQDWTFPSALQCTGCNPNLEVGGHS